MTFLKLAQAMALAATLIAAPASAATKLFRLFGDADGAFRLPATPTPSLSTGGYFAIYSTPGVLMGNATPLDLYIYLDSQGGGLDIQDADDPDTIFQLAGATIFEGTTTAPRFLSGSYDLVDLGTGLGSFTLVISDVPEPSSWAMLITGFGLVGAAARKRRAITPGALPTPPAA